jgi:hypothetical protein
MMGINIGAARKNEAYQFLKKLEGTLNSAFPSVTELQTLMRTTAGDSEDVFLSRFVIPKLYELMTAYDGMDAAKVA